MMVELRKVLLIGINIILVKNLFFCKRELKLNIFVCQKINMKEMANDVAPFLFNESDTKKIIHFESFLTLEKF